MRPSFFSLSWPLDLSDDLERDWHRVPGAGETLRAAAFLHAKEEARGGREREAEAHRGGDGEREEEEREGGAKAQTGGRRKKDVSDGTGKTITVWDVSVNVILLPLYKHFRKAEMELKRKQEEEDRKKREEEEKAIQVWSAFSLVSFHVFRLKTDIFSKAPYFTPLWGFWPILPCKHTPSH